MSCSPGKRRAGVAEAPAAARPSRDGVLLEPRVQGAKLIGEIVKAFGGLGQGVNLAGMVTISEPFLNGAYFRR